MDGQDLINALSECIDFPIHKYQGSLDKNGLRTNTGSEQWNGRDFQKYHGQFTQDSLHGRGKYCWTDNAQKTVYEGMFYANDLEGYGRFSYEDASTFEGLFKANRRFGPGVYTYADGSQDVGLWCGRDLMRLCCVVKPAWIPRLARTPAAKTRLLKFRTLVSLERTPQNRAKSILEVLEADEDVLTMSEKLYNVNVRNRNSCFFNAALHDSEYFRNDDCCIDVGLSAEESSVGKTFRKASNAFSTYDKCDCKDLQQIRLQELKSELDRNEAALQEITEEIKKYQYRKYLAKGKLTSVDNTQKSVIWEGDLLLEKFFKSADKQSTHVCEEDVEEEEHINYEESCKLLSRVESTERLLLRKKNDLIEKMLYENTSAQKSTTEVSHLSTKKVLVTHLLAWNNEKLSIEMLKHIFLHRNFEKDMSYSVADLLTGSREEFRTGGAYEEACITFLKECSNGNVRKAAKLLYKYDISPDLCDAKGNTATSYAAAQDKIKVILTLVNFGANIDSFNDECLTPLSMCIIRYLAVQHNVTNWETAFLKPTTIQREEEKEVLEWRPHASLTSIGSLLQLKSPKYSDDHSTTYTTSNISRIKLEAVSEVFGSNYDVLRSNASLNEFHQKLKKFKAFSLEPPEEFTYGNKDDRFQAYLFNIDCVKPTRLDKEQKKKNKGKSVKSKRSTSSKLNRTGSSKASTKSSKKFNKPSTAMERSKKTHQEAQPTKQVETEPQLQSSSKLNIIHETILTLLKCGANPDICEVPLPALILSLFTKNVNLVEDLLTNKANPNAVTLDESLTALHVLVSLPPSEEYLKILKLLLTYSADPNSKADILHWANQKTEILGNRVLAVEDDGKTPLHLLSMRYDFALDTNDYLPQMALALMENGGKMKLYYLGHTSLSLAVLRGNIKLIAAFLETKKVNPNHLLGENMGVPLTVYVLKRYKDILPDFNTCQQVIHMLIDYKANPFNYIEYNLNSIDFMIKEHEQPTLIKTTKKEKKARKNKSKIMPSKKDKKDKPKKKGKPTKQKSVQDEIKAYLISMARSVLERHTKGYAVHYLYFFVEEEDYYDDISANMAKFVTPDECIALCQLLIHRGRIPLNKSTNYYVVHDLVEFIININSTLKNSPWPHSSQVNIHKMLDNFEFKAIPKDKGKLNLPEPEVENHIEKYNVCFQCFRKNDRQLIICPECRLVYFCSEQCNKLNNLDKTSVHKCGTVFYGVQKQTQEERKKINHPLYEEHMCKMTLQNVISVRELQQQSSLYGQTKHHIEPDPLRRLHLTRHYIKKPTSSIASFEYKQYLAQTEDVPCSSELENNLRSVPDRMSSLKWKKEGSELLRWNEKGPKSDIDYKLIKGVGPVMTEEKYGQQRTAKEQEEKFAKNLGKQQKGLDNIHVSKKRGSKAESRGGMLAASSQKQADKLPSVEKFGVDSREFGTQKLAGNVPMPEGRKVWDLQRRLPSKYQFFLEKINEYWPDIDISMLFLPYACYRDGQLYYRFLTNDPVFMETYANM